MAQYDSTRVDAFGRKISPLVRGYLQEKGPGTIMAIPTAGRLFGVELYRRLLMDGESLLDVTYFEADKGDLLRVFVQNSGAVKNRHLIVVDDDIHTRQTFYEVSRKLSELKDEFDIRSVNWAVEFDGPGLATWSCNRHNVEHTQNTVERAVVYA